MKTAFILALGCLLSAVITFRDHITIQPLNHAVVGVYGEEGR